MFYLYKCLLQHGNHLILMQIFSQCKFQRFNIFSQSHCCCNTENVCTSRNTFLYLFFNINCISFVSHSWTWNTNNKKKRLAWKWNNRLHIVTVPLNLLLFAYTNDQSSKNKLLFKIIRLFLYFFAFYKKYIKKMFQWSKKKSQTYHTWVHNKRFDRDPNAFM